MENYKLNRLYRIGTNSGVYARCLHVHEWFVRFRVTQVGSHNPSIHNKIITISKPSLETNNVVLDESVDSNENPFTEEEINDFVTIYMHSDFDLQEGLDAYREDDENYFLSQADEEGWSYVIHLDKWVNNSPNYSPRDLQIYKLYTLANL